MNNWYATVAFSMYMMYLRSFGGPHDRTFGYVHVCVRTASIFAVQ